jgi:hypothetical protein
MKLPHCVEITHDELTLLLKNVPESKWEKIVLDEFKRKKAIQCQRCQLNGRCQTVALGNKD